MTHWGDAKQFHIIAHRGASAYAPDNSLEALELAREYSATDVEIDLHCTVDGEFVIRHDALLNQKSAVYISELAYAEYEGICEQYNQPCIRLYQVIDLARQLGLGIYLDIKQVLPDALPKLFEVVQSREYQDEIVFASFRTDIAREIKQQAPHLNTSVLFHDPNMDLNSLVDWTRCDFLHPCFDVFDDPLKFFTDSWVRRVRSLNVGIVAWNITTAAVADEVVHMDVQGACADDPQLLRDALAK